MAQNSKIEWTHHTFNPWVGCTRVSPACDHCYAETWAKRYNTVEWGTGKPRKLTSESNWQQPLKWNREAEHSGERKRVFCASLADVFDNEVPDAWRYRLWDLIEATPNLDWLLLTKRIGNVKKMMKARWLDYPMANVWLGISVVTQQEAERDIPKLAAINAKVRFLSMEPLLEAIDLRALKTDHNGRLNAFLHDRIHWVIVGGESGTEARPMQAEWARSLRYQCVEFGIPFHFKQWGEWAPYDRSRMDGSIMATPYSGDKPIQHFGKKLAGRLLDGRTWDGYPLQASKG